MELHAPVHRLLVLFSQIELFLTSFSFNSLLIPSLLPVKARKKKKAKTKKKKSPLLDFPSKQTQVSSGTLPVRGQPFSWTDGNAVIPDNILIPERCQFLRCIIKALFL